jgi:hypothetical protein
VGESESDVVVVSAGEKGSNDLNMLSHEASVIANTESPKTRTIDFFIGEEFPSASHLSSA